MKTLSEALFSRKNLKDSKDIYTFEDLLYNDKKVLITWPEWIGVYDFEDADYHELIGEIGYIWYWSANQGNFSSVKNRIIKNEFEFNHSNYKNEAFRCYLLDNVSNAELKSVYNSMYDVCCFKDILYEDALDAILSCLKNTNMIPIDIVDK